jgi:hypothetical protein
VHPFEPARDIESVGDVGPTDPRVGEAALKRALMLVANQIESSGLEPKIALKTAQELLKTDEGKNTLLSLVPYLERNTVALAGSDGKAKLLRAATTALPLIADEKAVMAVLKAAQEVGGMPARRLTGAAMRGIAQGKGVTGAAVEVAATAARMGSKSTKLAPAVAETLGKAAPLVGNAVNLYAVGSSAKQAYDVFRDPESTTGRKVSASVHLAATVTGCFIPQASLVATALDVRDSVYNTSPKTT